MRRSVFLLVIYTIFCSEIFATSLEKHLKKIENKVETSQIRNIDFIYLINLDQRPEKLQKVLDEFSPYGIQFFRFPAIYGWSLPLLVTDDLGVLFQPGMREKAKESINYNGIILTDPRTTAEPEIPGEFHVLGPNFYGKNCFSVSMKGGAIGCTMSHLSILQDALDSGYQTIWILEDDVKACEDPRQLSDWIDRLDSAVGKDGWDVLYTDCITYFKGHNDINWIWRPDIPIDYAKLTKVKDIGDFLQIGGRGNTHSMIIKRSGIKKILEFYKEHGMFVPYDQELSIVPGILLYNLKRNVVVQNHVVSDTVRKNFD